MTEVVKLADRGVGSNPPTQASRGPLGTVPEHKNQASIVYGKEVIRMSRKPRRDPDIFDRMFGWPGQYKAHAKTKGGGCTHGWGSTKKSAQDRANCNARRGKRF